MWDVAVCMHDAQALLRLLKPPYGLSLAKTGNQARKPRLRTKNKNGEKRIKNDKDGEKEIDKKGLPGFRNILAG